MVISLYFTIEITCKDLLFECIGLHFSDDYNDYIATIMIRVIIIVQINCELLFTPETNINLDVLRYVLFLRKDLRKYSANFYGDKRKHNKNNGCKISFSSKFN